MTRAPKSPDGVATNNDSGLRFVKKPADSPVPSEVEAEVRLHLEGFTDVFRWHDVAGAEYPSHEHGKDECLWVLEGRLELTIEGRTFELDPGDRLYLPVHLAHTAVVPRSQKRGTTYLIGQRKKGGSNRIQPHIK